MPIIRSLLENDLYTFSVQNAILAKYPGVKVKYKFINRRKEGRFNQEFLKALGVEIQSMQGLRLKSKEEEYLDVKCPYLERRYVGWLKDYRFRPEETSFDLVDGELELEVEGKWESAIMWEVPLLAVVTELFYRHCDTNWAYDVEAQRAALARKASILDENRVPFAEFGTRRRRSYEVQDLAVDTLKRATSFLGTSNVYLAMKYGVPAVGTMSHQWIMGVSALEGLRHANRHAMRAWFDVYKGSLGVFLPDTFGTANFWGDCDKALARQFDGLRQDSGDPYAFGEEAIVRYRERGCDPAAKKVVFSDALDVPAAVGLAAHFRDRLKVSCGLGGHFTHDFPGSPAPNFVIKMTECDGVPVVKLSDSPGKATGDRDAVRVAKWTFDRTPLDA